MAYDMRLWAAESMRLRERRPGTRWFLLLGVAVLVLAPAIEMFDPGDPADPFPAYVGAGALPLIGGISWSPFARETWITARGRATFDEREQVAMAGAFRRAHAATLVLLVALFACAVLATSLGVRLPHLTREWTALGIAVVMLVATLPVIFAEWTVPLPPAADDTEDRI